MITKRASLLGFLLGVFALTSVNAAVNGGSLIVKETEPQGNEALSETKFGDNWFLGGSAGANYNWSGISEGGFGERIRPALALSAGKWFVPQFGVRGQVFMNNNREWVTKEWDYLFNTMGFYVDGLVSLTNLIGKYKENQPVNFYGLVGIGLESSTKFSVRGWNEYPDGLGYNDELGSYFGFRIGVGASVRLSSCLDLTVEATNAFAGDKYDGLGSGGGDKHFNLMFGLSYRFRNHDGSHQFTYARAKQKKEVPQYNNVDNEQINTLREEISQEEAKQIEESVKGTSGQVIVSFKDNTTNLDVLGEDSVNKVGRDWTSQFKGQTDIYITPLSSVGTDKTLFYLRGQAIRDLLVKNFNIPAGLIFVEQNPKLVQQINKSRQCVVVYIK